MFLLIPFNRHTAASSHAITLLSFLEQNSVYNIRDGQSVGRHPVIQTSRQTHLTAPHYTFIRYVQRMLENNTTLMWFRDYLSLLGGSILVFMSVASKGVTDDQRRSPERLR